ncbi:XRE family transcriptional regulator [Pseudomonas iridis]|uniref:XRE family transcriptional regulator n=1 Tax=Pseudomonas iridis TaxID=2710587 RepID=UPI001B33E93C|nr:S24 family peptidase [Pseudomonas iridis]MBP5969433.1 S24 family peptidase [Pseudomonas iridis]
MKITDRITKLVLARRPEVSARSFKRDIATTCGVSYEAVRQWFAGDTSNIRNENLVSIAEGYDTTVDWLLSGKGEPPSRKSVAAESDSGAENSSASSVDLVRQMLTKVKGLSDEARERIVAAAEEPGDVPDGYQQGNLASLRPKNDEILIPQYDVRGAMGHGQVPADYNEAVRNLVVREEILREKGVSYTAASALAMITGWGQSMEGTINDKDLVIVDRGVKEFIGEGIYVVTWHQELYIKRMMRLDEEHYRLISDNQHYENQTARVDDVTIHAKVLFIWNGRKA